MTLPLIRVACAVIIHQKKVFAACRGEHMRHAFHWEFPGGKVEPGESDEECLHRELAEELDMRVVVKSNLPHVFYQYHDFAIELIPFLCHVEDMFHISAEHHETAWISRDKLEELVWAPADIALMEYTRDHLLT